METLPQGHHKELLDYLPHIQTSLGEWLFIYVRLMDTSSTKFTITLIAERLHTLSKDKEGRLYIRNDHEIFMIVQWGGGHSTSSVADSIGKDLLKDRCIVRVHEPTLDGIAKFEILLADDKQLILAQAFSDIRGKRKEKIILVADDDMYQRAVIRKGLSKIGTVIEASNGDDVEKLYRQYNPDILFLDIHMPGKSGMEIIYQISEIDADSYVIMISADSSQENVADTWQKGAKDFLTKPITKEKLLGCVKLCPTISHATKEPPPIS